MTTKTKNELMFDRRQQIYNLIKQNNGVIRIRFFTESGSIRSMNVGVNAKTAPVAGKYDEKFNYSEVMTVIDVDISEVRSFKLSRLIDYYTHAQLESMT